MDDRPIIPPELARLRREFPVGWHIWQGIGGLWYARKLKSSPPIVLRAEDPDGLRVKIRNWKGRPKANPDCPACFGTGYVHAGMSEPERCQLCAGSL